MTRRDAHSPSEVEAKLDDIAAVASDTEVCNLAHYAPLSFLIISVAFQHIFTFTSMSKKTNKKKKKKDKGGTEKSIRKCLP